MILVLATRNKGKVREIGSALAMPSLTFQSLNDFPDLPEVIEDGGLLPGKRPEKSPDRFVRALICRFWPMTRIGSRYIERGSGDLFGPVFRPSGHGSGEQRKTPDPAPRGSGRKADGPFCLCSGSLSPFRPLGPDRRDLRRPHCPGPDRRSGFWL